MNFITSKFLNHENIKKKSPSNIEGRVCAIEALVRNLSEQLAELHEGLRLAQSGYGEPSTKKRYNIFNPVIDEDKLAACFEKLYRSYISTGQGTPAGKRPDDMAFATFLFILVEHEHLGKSDFSDLCKKPFYEFVCEKVIPHLQGTGRTFHNRLESLKPFRHHLIHPSPNESVRTRFESGDNYQYFHRLLTDYHRSGYYYELKRLE